MLLINGRFMTQPLTGVQRFARAITVELLRLRDDVEILVPARTPVLEEYQDLPRTPIGRHTGHAWEQLSLPTAAATRGGPLLSLTSTAPIVTRNQVVTHHDITYVRYPESFPRSFRALYRVITPMFLRAASGIVTVSEFSQSEISTFYRIPPSKFIVAHNAVDEQFFVDDNLPREDNFLLTVSSPSAHKNFGRLVDAYALLDPVTRPPLKIVGSTASALVRPEVASLPGVEFIGRVDDDDLARLYRNALAFVFPSLYEGFGIPPLEAQTSRTPVVAADIPAMNEVLGASALLFDPTSVESITQALRAVLALSAEQRLDLISKGVENAARFSWTRSAEAISALVDHVRRDQ